MTINLSPEIEDRLRSEAERRGVGVNEYAQQLLNQALPPQPTGQPQRPGQTTIDLLNKWEADDWTDDQEELARRRRELEEFMAAMNRSRREMEGPQSRTPFP